MTDLVTQKNTGGVKNSSHPSALFSGSTPPFPHGKGPFTFTKSLACIWRGGGMTKKQIKGKNPVLQMILEKNIQHLKISCIIGLWPKKTCKKNSHPPHLPLHISKWCLPCKMLNMTKWKNITKWIQWKSNWNVKKYILKVNLSAARTKPNIEYIFSKLAIKSCVFFLFFCSLSKKKTPPLYPANQRITQRMNTYPHRI